MKRSLMILSIAAANFATSYGSEAGDWPRLHGPDRDGTYTGGDVIESWPKDPPKTLWKRDVGEGFSGLVGIRTGDGLRVFLFHRPGDVERLECLDALSGKLIWKSETSSDYHDRFGFNSGPRATPTIANGNVFTYGASGRLRCLDLDGHEVWEVKTREAFKVRQGFFGAASSPLVEGERLFLNVGARNAGIVAFEARTGKVLWKATDHEGSYSSPTLAKIGDAEHLVFFTREGIVDLDPADGRVRFKKKWRARIGSSVNAATPIIVDDRVFISSSYQTGAILLRIQKGDTYEKIWSGDGILSNHYATSIYHDGFLYGFDGRQEYGAHLRCVEFGTGKLRWSQDRFGSGTMIRSGDSLLLLDDKGKLHMIRANATSFQELGSHSILENETRPYPALIGGLFLARDNAKLVCVDLRKKP